MRRKTICKTLAAKVTSLAEYVRNFTVHNEKTPKYALNLPLYQDPDLPDDIQKGTIVTGGAIVSFLLQDQPNDYDCYLTVLNNNTQSINSSDG